MPTALITGAGRGLGLEFTRQFAEDGWTVLAGLRDMDNASVMAGIDGDIAVVPLDVADPASVAILGERLAGTPIDLLINNAGFLGPREIELGAIDYDDWREVLEVNTLAPMRVAEAFIDHLRAGKGRKIVTISSRLGSIAEGNGGRYIYRSSKAAVNAVMKNLAQDLVPEGFTVIVMHPGWVRTDMGGPGASIDAVESVTGLKRVIDGLARSDTGGFFNYDGTPIPW